MLQFSPIRTAIIIIVALLGILYTVPNFLTKDQLAALPGWVPKQTVTLGLDLQGGSYLLLEVNRAGIINDRLTELRRDARNILANQNGIGNIITINGNNLSIELTDPTQRQKADTALQALQNNVGGSVIGIGGVKELAFTDTPDGKISIGLTDDGVNQRMSSLVTQSMEVIRKRIDQLGTTEPQIQREGNDRVLVQVPGFQDSARLKEIISKTAPLNKVRHSARLCASWPPSLTRSMACETASTTIWLPMDLRATLSDCTRGTPAPRRVPNMRQKRAMANWLTRGPTTGALKIKPSQTRRPFSEPNQPLAA